MSRSIPRVIPILKPISISIPQPLHLAITHIFIETCEMGLCIGIIMILGGLGKVIPYCNMTTNVRSIDRSSWTYVLFIGMHYPTGIRRGSQHAAYDYRRRRFHKYINKAGQKAWGRSAEKGDVCCFPKQGVKLVSECVPHV